MKRVPQRARDDCLAACLASLLELPLADVPNYCRAAKSGSDLFAKVQRWLARKHAMTLVTIMRPDPPPPFAEWISRQAVPAKFIACVWVGDWHAVCASISGGRARVLHDPAGHPPRRVNLKTTDNISFLVPLKPALLAKGSRLR